MKVFFLPDVENYLFELIEILFKKEYFGFKSSAVKYVSELVLEIEKTLPKSTRRQAPKHFSRFGKDMFYSFYRQNKNTTWYVFFSIYRVDNEDIYVVKYISNNHVAGKHITDI